MSFNFDLELPNLEFIGDYSIALKILIKLSGNGKLQGIFSKDWWGFWESWILYFKKVKYILENCYTHVTATGKITDEFDHVEFQLVRNIFSTTTRMAMYVSNLNITEGENESIICPVPTWKSLQ